MNPRSLWIAPLSLSSLVLALVVVGAASGGCSSTTGDAADAAPAEDVQGSVTCKNDSRAEVYTANMEKDGISKLVKFTLVKADPGPPLKGSANQWMIKVTDMTAQPIADVDVTISAKMPDHAHSWSTVPTVTKNADGTFTFDKMNMFMHGIWQVTFQATAGTMLDSATYSFCID